MLDFQASVFCDKTSEEIEVIRFKLGRVLAIAGLRALINGGSEGDLKAAPLWEQNG